jgi:hypothetical protein
MLAVFVIMSVILVGCELRWYVWFTPTLYTPVSASTRLFTHFLYGLAQILGVARLPYAVLPYVCKALLWVVLGSRFKSVWSRFAMQIVRLVGDGLNFLIVSALLMPLLPLAQICIVAEALRLMAEKGQTAWSGAWQYLPHRRIANRFGHWAFLPAFLRRYCNYYRLSDEQRMIYILRLLRHASQHQSEAARKLDYITRFCIVPDEHGLRQAEVRDVAAGIIYIHQRWTNDPYLLIGVAVRRSPWLFDPRYLARPFYYRTQANPLMTRFVLDQWRMSPPFAWYQWGHEIKAARFTLFFRACRWLGHEMEVPVNEHGVYAFDPLLNWLCGISRPQTALWSDAKVMALHAHDIERLSPYEIAERYTYPEMYVEDVLWHKVYTVTPPRLPLPVSQMTHDAVGDSIS